MRTDRTYRPLALAAALAATLLGTAPAAAQETDLGFRGWGLRAGAASDPDQAIVGVHWDLGELLEDLRLQPSVDLGFGDDVATFSLLVPVHYRFEIASDVTPYAGGGVLLAVLDRDDPPRGRGRDDEEDFDIAPVAVGGLEIPIGRGRDLLLELHLGGGDAFDAKFVAGWSF